MRATRWATKLASWIDLALREIRNSSGGTLSILTQLLILLRLQTTSKASTGGWAWICAICC